MCVVCEGTRFQGIVLSKLKQIQIASKIVMLTGVLAHQLWVLINLAPPCLLIMSRTPVPEYLTFSSANQAYSWCMFMCTRIVHVYPFSKTIKIKNSNCFTLCICTMKWYAHSGVWNLKTLQWKICLNDKIFSQWELGSHLSH